MAIKDILNRETIKSTIKQTFIGAGVGILAGHAVSVLCPAASIAAHAGMAFGILFKLSSLIDSLVGAGLNNVFERLGLSEIVERAELSIYVGRVCLTRGALAFGITALLFSGVTLYSGLALTAVIATVDIISLFTLQKTWMLDISVGYFKHSY